MKFLSCPELMRLLNMSISKSCATDIISSSLFLFSKFLIIICLCKFSMSLLSLYNFISYEKMSVISLRCFISWICFCSLIALPVIWINSATIYGFCLSLATNSCYPANNLDSISVFAIVSSSRCYFALTLVWCFLSLRRTMPMFANLTELLSKYDSHRR